MPARPPADDYAILATDAAPDGETHVLKAGETFAVLDRHGDVRPGGLGHLGLYADGTRMLSRLELGIAGRRPLLLSSRVTEDDAVSVVDGTNPDVPIADGGVLRRETLHLRRTTVASEGALHVCIEVHNYGLAPVGVDVDVLIDADFADVFEVRGTRRAARGRRMAARVEGDAVRLAYHGLDGRVRETVVRFEPPPRLLGARASWPLALAPGARTTLGITVASRAAEPVPTFRDARGAALEALRARAAPLAVVRTAHEPVDACFRRAAADLALMLTPTPQGPYPYAGVPWFCTPFGRDGLVTALEVLWLHPPVAAGVLRFLAATQATEADPARDAEPGKILHEARAGEMAALGEIPFGRYYGTIDATPLFVLLAGAYWHRTGDRALVEELWPHLRAALAWIETGGDRDGDGFVEYARQHPHGLRHQGWKDSEDAVSHADGRLAEGPIALAEVQAYVYGAHAAAATLASALGERELAARQRAAAVALQRRFHAAFWCEDLATYALALDGAKRPCRVRASNAGQCLLTGIVPEEAVGRVAASLLEDDLFSGFGVRTLGTRERRHNPLSYHNGSVWPHDNALIAAGLARHGRTADVLPLFEGMLDAAAAMPLARLPELFCGFPRRRGEGPTLYPVACAPQAWAAGAPFLLLAAALGLEVSAPERRVVLTRPQLPAPVEQLAIQGLAVGDARVDLEIVGGRDAPSVRVRTSGRVDVVTIR